ncbi:MAG TPA: phosphate signaling complex protein PhoU [Aeromonadales bacterium]|nr:phosphate signaling complex protein PhoU [Aeromonadales bacterium]
MESRNVTQHISQQFNDELETLREQVMAMGGLVEKQLTDAIETLVDMDDARAQKIIQQDTLVNALEVKIDEECTKVLAKRQPAAGDLRLIIAIIKTVTDLERIGDEAEKIARMTLEIFQQEPLIPLHKKHLKDIKNLGKHVIEMVRNSLDAFARMDVDAAMQVAKQEQDVDEQYAALSRQLITYMMEDPRSISSILDVTWVARALERVGDHANNIAEYTIYLVKGKDVRHTSFEKMEQVARGGQ